MSENNIKINPKKKHEWMINSVLRLDNIPADKPILIAGPTASGKSALAMALAARDGRVIVNADALQVYSCWRVISARPSVIDEATLPHALYGHIAAQDTYSVGHWLREIAPFLSKPVVIVGGTGLYFTALTQGLSVIPPIPAQIRAKADALRLHDFSAMKAALDPLTGARIDLANPARVQRAWEVLFATGKGLAAWQDKTPPPLLPLQSCTPLVLDPDVEWLNQRIQTRFAQMLACGALDEVRTAQATWDPRQPASKAIGVPELMDYLSGACTLSDAQDAAIIATRQYAKRQRTWFRNRMKSWLRMAIS